MVGIYQEHKYLWEMPPHCSVICLSILKAHICTIAWLLLDVVWCGGAGATRWVAEKPKLGDGRLPHRRPRPPLPHRRQLGHRVGLLVAEQEGLGAEGAGHVGQLSRLPGDLAAFQEERRRWTQLQEERGRAWWVPGQIWHLHLHSGCDKFFYQKM